jgi:hypothetical protein
MGKMRLLAAVALAAGLVTTACQAPTTARESASACADDGPTFPGTSICVGRSVNFMDPDALAAMPPPREGCEAWAPQATMLGDGEALLYMAATCKGAPTTLTFADGKLTYGTGEMAGYGGDLIEIFDAPEQALAPLYEKMEALPAAERAECLVQSAGYDGPLAQAVVIGPTAAVRAKAPTDQPNAFCGPYGLNEDESSFWLVRQGKAMFFQLGQEQQDIDAASVTLMRADADGAWSAVAPFPEAPLAECLLVVDGKTYLDGVCGADKDEDGSFRVFGKDYFVYAGKLDDGKFNVSWNERPEYTHAAALLGEDFVQDGACLTGARGKVCSWPIGGRK